MAALVDVHPSGRRGPATKMFDEKHRLCSACAKTRQASKTVSRSQGTRGSRQRGKAEWGWWRRRGEKTPPVAGAGEASAAMRGQGDRASRVQRLLLLRLLHSTWRGIAGAGVICVTSGAHLPRITSCCTGSVGLGRCRFGALDDAIVDEEGRDGILKAALYSSGVLSLQYGGCRREGARGG